MGAIILTDVKGYNKKYFIMYCFYNSLITLSIRR